MYSLLENYDMAIKTTLKVLEIEPENENAFNCLGWYYIATGMYQQSIKNLSKACDMNNKSWDSLLGLSLALFSDNQKTQAKEKFNATCTMEPRLKEGMAGIEKLEKEGYIYQQAIKNKLKVFFVEILK